MSSLSIRLEATEDCYAGEIPIRAGKYVGTRTIDDPGLPARYTVAVMYTKPGTAMQIPTTVDITDLVKAGAILVAG